jgi:hypothetical protein
MARKAKALTVEQQLEAIDAKRKRWVARLTRAVNAINKLDKQRKRIVKKGQVAVAPRPRGHVRISDPVGTFGPAIRESIQDQNVLASIAPPKPEPVADDLGIPTFLQRKKLDPVAAEIKAEQEETKRKKAQGRIAKLKAKKSGATKAMPLTGKAALDAIRNGDA